MTYIIDYSGWFDEGGCCQVYPIKNHSDLVFKEFRNKNKAVSAYSIQKKLAYHDLAPNVYSKVCKLNFNPEEECTIYETSDWGYVTERAKVCDKVALEKIQTLVDEIYNHTGLSFWDCHYYNVGFVNRLDKSKLVCIDTGKESFLRDSNAWGFSFPGPKCNYCDKYQCECSEV